MAGLLRFSFGSGALEMYLLKWSAEAAHRFTHAAVLRELITRTSVTAGMLSIVMLCGLDSSLSGAGVAFLLFK